MKKLLYTICLLLALLCIFTACDKQEAPQTEPNPTDTENKQPAHVHSFGEWTVLESSNCATQGKEKRTCTCGESETRTLDISSHSFANGVCLLCGATDGLAYKASTDGTSFLVNGIGTCAATDIVIPAYRDGKPITGIEENAFLNCTALVSVKIPATVKKIGGAAFAGCTSLTTVEMAEGVTEIGEEAFYACTQLSRITLPASIQKATSPFINCPSLQYTLYNNGKYLGNTTTPCLYLAGVADTTVSFFEVATGTKIIDNAFHECTALSSITLPTSLSCISGDAFYDCTTLTNVFITDLAAWCAIEFSDSPDTPFYRASNLYLNNTLVTHLDIPSSVTELKKYAFYGCESITSVTLPDGMTSIASYAFRKCIALASLTIPASVINIGYNAFGECSSLTAVNFAQTDGWWCADSASATNGTAISTAALSSSSVAATCLTSNYCYKVWHRTVE